LANLKGNVATIVDRRFPALLHRDFRLMWFGQIVSIAGSQMQNVGIALQIWDLTHSKVMLGLVGLARVIPIILFSLVGGGVADAYPRRRVMLFSQSMMMMVAVVLALLTSSGSATATLILVLTSVGAAASAFDGPARQALMPNLVPPEHFSNAVSLNTTMFQLALIIGPALSGLLIARYTEVAVYWINAASFLAVIAALLMMRVVEKREAGGARPNVASILEGLRFVREHRIIMSTMLLDFFATFFATAAALIPVFAYQVLGVGRDQIGFLYSAEAAGSLVAGIIMSFIGDIGRKGRVLLISVVVYGIATAAYGFSTNYLLSLFLLALIGAGDSVSTVLRQTIRQMSTPDHLRGRTTAVNMIFFMGGPQLGNFEAGLAAAAFGAQASVVFGGLAVIGVVALTAWRFPLLRKYDR
jgi:MFS family permease